ncbi:MAG TPA: PAS domain-containing protein [Opitutaceae bacterium]|nr:PAS domain-containing protein [Opitutaceae bacterium]
MNFENASAAETIESLRDELARCRRELAECQQRADHANRSCAAEADKRQCLLATLEAAQIGLWEGEIKNFSLAEQWSPRFREIFGVPLDAEVSQELFLKCIHPDDRERIERAVVEAVSGANGGRYRAEYRIVKPIDGSVRWVKAWGQAFLSREGKIDRLIGTVLDVTSGKFLEQENARLQAEFEDLFEEAPIPYVHEGSDTRFIRANRAARKLHGIESDDVSEILGSSLVANTQENQRRLRESLSLVRTGLEFEPVLLELHRKDSGNPVWVHAWSRPAPAGGCTRTMYWDVTDWVLMEQTKAALELTLESGQVGDWDLDLERGTSRRSGRYDQCFGYAQPIPESEWGIDQFIQHVHPEDRMRVDGEVRQAIATSEYWKSEFRVVWPDGSLHWIAAGGSTYHMRDGKATHLVGIVMDITDRKRAEEALRASEQLARGQIEALKGSLEALAREPAPERLVEHIMRTITRQWGAHSSSFWRRNTAKDRVCFEFAFEEDRLVAKDAPRFAGMDLELPMEEFWPWPEVFRTGKASLIEDIRMVRPFALRDRLLPLGIITVLLIPMTVGGRLEGAIGLRFARKQTFRSEEIELAQTLANQAMLAMELARLSAESRESAVNAERNRLARDIHDTLAQGFTGVIVQLEAAAGAAAQNDFAMVAERMRQASDLARSGLGEARRSIRALRPESLCDGTLFTALHGLLKRMATGTNLSADFRIEGQPRPMPAAWEDTLLRITQESLTNTIKHARARTFHAVLGFRFPEIQLRLVDDGRGFEMGNETDGFGLIGMKERVTQIGGQFKLRSEPGAGVEILVTLGATTDEKPGQLDATT